MDKRMPAFVLCLAALVLAAASFLRLMQDRAVVYLIYRTRNKRE